MIQLSAEEFKSYEIGLMVTVLYDPKEPQIAEILKTVEQLKRIQRKPYFVALFGLMMLVIATMLGKLWRRLS